MQSNHFVENADLQVIVPIDTQELIDLIRLGHSVCRARKGSIDFDGTRDDTYTIGGIDRLQLCIYNKRFQVVRDAISNPTKFQLFLDYCCGTEWYSSDKPITRVEYRMGRDLLNEYEINSVNDLLEREIGMVRFLTTKWFRLLEDRGCRGHENKQAVHSYWKSVQESFERWFTGHPELEEKDFERRAKRMSCDSEALDKQAVGCIASAVASKYDVKGDPAEQKKTIKAHVNSLVDKELENIKSKALVRQKKIETQHNVRIIAKPAASQDATDFDHQKNCGMDIDEKAICEEFSDGIVSM